MIRPPPRPPLFPNTPLSRSAATAAIAYSPQSFHLTLASGGKVTWINKDTTSHTVTSNQTGQFDSGTFGVGATWSQDRKSTRLNSSHSQISYAVFCLKKTKTH